MKEAAGFQNRWDIRQRNVRTAGREKMVFAISTVSDNAASDRAAMAVLEGRVIVMCDNSPIGLILPTDYNSFIRTSDDYYSRFEIATFGRILRYLASFFAMTLPGFLSCGD